MMGGSPPIGGVGQAPVAGNSQPAPQPAPSNQTLIAKLDVVALKLDNYAKAEAAKAESSVKNFFSKHWPWMLGVLVGASRWIHL